MALLPPTSEASKLADASERFDKKTLLQFHDLTCHRLENVPESIFGLYKSDSRNRRASLVRLENMDPISLTQLQVFQVHLSRVLYGTLYVEAFKTSGIIVTMLEDDNGLAIRLAIYNVHHS